MVEDEDFKISLDALDMQHREEGRFYYRDIKLLCKDNGLDCRRFDMFLVA